MIKDFREEVSSLKSDYEQLKSDVENQEQYSRRNCLLVQGIPEERRENVDSIVLNAVNGHLERTRRLGKPKQNKNKPKSTIIKVMRYNCRRRTH